MKVQHPAAEWGLEIHDGAHFIWPERIVSCFSCFLLLSALLEMLFWKNIQGSLFMGSVKRSLKCFYWHRQACQQEFGRTRRLFTIQAEPMNLHTPGSTVHLTCRSWSGRRRRRSWFNYSFFSSSWHPAITLAPCGEQKGHSEAFILAQV